MRSETEVREVFTKWNANATWLVSKSVAETLKWVLSGDSWHDAKKELPENDQLVIMWIKGDSGAPEGGYILDGFYSGTCFFSPDGEDHEPIAWMPRPSKPSFWNT